MRGWKRTGCPSPRVVDRPPCGEAARSPRREYSITELAKFLRELGTDPALHLDLTALRRPMDPMDPTAREAVFVRGREKGVLLALSSVIDDQARWRKALERTAMATADVAFWANRERFQLRQRGSGDGCGWRYTHLDGTPVPPSPTTTAP